MSWHCVYNEGHEATARSSCLKIRGGDRRTAAPGGTMNRWTFIAVALCVLAAGCGDENQTAPSNVPLIFSAILSPANEVPPVGNAESGGRGAVQVQFDVTRGAGDAITSATASFYYQLSGFPAGTTLVGAHIHPAAAGVNGPVVLSTGLTATSTVSLPNGTGEFRVSGIAADSALVQSIVNNPAAFYFNVHSPLNPGGFSRGQLTRVQ
jgi:hypothetical protein